MRRSWIWTIVIIAISALNLSNCKIQYTDKENNAIQMLRSRVLDILYQDYMKTDEFLVTWIRDKSFDLDKAEKKLRKAIEWRKANDIDSVLDDPQLNTLKKSYPYAIEGHDRDGRPILAFKFGAWNLRKVVLAGKLPLMRRYLNGLSEKGIMEARRLSKSNGKDITQWYWIIEMSGYNLREHGCLACYPVYLNYVIDYESNYPETTKWILLINTPKIFDTIAQLVRPLMSPGTRAAFKIYGTNPAEWKFFIFNESNVDPKDLSTAYGGTWVK